MSDTPSISPEERRRIMSVERRLKDLEAAVVRLDDISTQRAKRMVRLYERLWAVDGLGLAKEMDQ